MLKSRHGKSMPCLSTSPSKTNADLQDGSQSYQQNFSSFQGALEISQHVTGKLAQRSHWHATAFAMHALTSNDILMPKWHCCPQAQDANAASQPLSSNSGLSEPCDSGNTAMAGQEGSMASMSPGSQGEAPAIATAASEGPANPAEDDRVRSCA